MLGMIVTTLILFSLAGDPAAVPVTTPAPASAPSGAPLDLVKELPGEAVFVQRVGGDMTATATFDERLGWLYTHAEAGRMRIETALPEGYPAPTPPGAIDIKRYPSVRRAEVSSEGNLSGSGGFWPLFRHIQRNDIAMTAPVEMDYVGIENVTNAKKIEPTKSTMSFLYRTRNLHPTGVDPKNEKITIRDTEPVLVVALGGRGDIELSNMKPMFEKLEAWLKANPQWEVAGPYRTFGYNGPDTRRSRRWTEAQIPIRRVVSAPAAATR